MITSLTYGTTWDDELQEDVPCFNVIADGKEGYSFSSWLDETNVDILHTQELDFGSLLENGNVSLKAYARQAVLSQTEINTIAAFLRLTDGTKTNAQKLGITPDDITTWNGRIEWDKENITEINFSQDGYADGEKIIGTLNVSGFPELGAIRCTDTAIEKLYADNCPELNDISCWNARLNTLSFTNCPRLQHVDCFGNDLTSLDFTGVTSLRNFKCAENLITSLDLSALNLEWLDTRDNPMTYIKTRMQRENAADLPSEYFIELHGSDAYVNLFYDDYDGYRSMTAYMTCPAGYKSNGWYSDSGYVNLVSGAAEYEISRDASCTLYAKSAFNAATGISVVGHPRLHYFAGDLFDIEGLRIRVNYENGESREMTTGFNVSYADGQLLGFGDNGKALTVSYMGITEAVDNLHVAGLCDQGVDNGMLICEGSGKSVELLGQSVVNRGYASNSSQVSVFTSDSVTPYSGVNKTGLIVKVDNGSTVEYYTVCLLGDVTCDGYVNHDDFNAVLCAGVDFDAQSGGFDKTNALLRRSVDYSGDDVIDALDAAHMELFLNGWA